MTQTLDIGFLSPVSAFFQLGLKLVSGPLGRELEALGFSRLGTMCEETSGGLRTPSLAFASEKHQAWANIFQASNGAPHLFFYTLFEDGRLVLTGAYPRDREETDRAILSGVAGAPVSEVLAAHSREVAKFRPTGAPVPASLDRRARLDAARRFFDNPKATSLRFVVRIAA